MKKSMLRKIQEAVAPVFHIYTLSGYDCDGGYCWFAYLTYKQANDAFDPDYPHMARFMLKRPISLGTYKTHRSFQPEFFRDEVGLINLPISIPETIVKGIADRLWNQYATHALKHFEHMPKWMRRLGNWYTRRLLSIKFDVEMK